MPFGVMFPYQRVFEKGPPGKWEKISLPFALDGDDAATLTKDIRHVIVSALNKHYIIIVHSQRDANIILSYFPDVEHPALKIQEEKDNIYMQFDLMALSILRP